MKGSDNLKYIIKIINHKENIYRDLCECATYDEMYGRLLHEIIYTAREDDIIVATIYGRKHLPDGSIVYRYKDGILYHHMWSIDKTIAEIVKTE